MQSSQFLTEKTTSFSPFIFSLISLIAGIYWQNLFACNNFVLITAIVASLFLLLNKIGAVRLFFYLLFFFCGAFIFQNKKDYHMLQVNAFTDKRWEVVAKVINIEKNAFKETGDIIKLKIEKIKEREQANFAQISFNVLCYSTLPTSVEVGDLIHIKNIYFPKQKTGISLSQNPSFNEYLMKENIVSSVFIKKLYYKLIKRPKICFSRWISNKKHDLYEKLNSKLLPETAAYFFPIFLGYKKNNSFECIKDPFSYWGLAHYLARAGLHISLFILIWKFLLNLLPFSLFLKRFFLLLICIIYNLFSWTSIPFIRAFYAFLICEVGKILNQQINFFHVLTTLCLLILIFNPMQILFLDFQLSFGLTFALSWVGNLGRINRPEELPQTLTIRINTKTEC